MHSKSLIEFLFQGRLAKSAMRHTVHPVWMKMESFIPRALTFAARINSIILSLIPRGYIPPQPLLLSMWHA